MFKDKEKHEVSCRAARLADLPVLYEFEQGIVAFERPYDETLKPDPINYYDLKKMILSVDSEVIVAIVKGEVVGSAYIKIAEAKPYLKHFFYGYLGFMFVKSEYRGHGINKKIIEKLKAWARSKNLNELRLDVYDKNDSAVKAYEKAGFKKHLVNMRIGI